MYRAILGKPMGTLYGYKAIGLYQTEEQIANSPTAPSGEKRLGDLMYADVNGDGKIEQSQDFIKIGRGYTPDELLAQYGGGMEKPLSYSPLAGCSHLRLSAQRGILFGRFRQHDVHPSFLRQRQRTLLSRGERLA